MTSMYKRTSIYFPESGERGEAEAGDAPAPRFRLAPGLWPRDLFAVDAAGRLVLAGQLDRETAAEHVIGETSTLT